MKRIVLGWVLAILAGSPALAGSVPVRAPRGMVVSQSGLASEIGAAVLREGGSAIDAAVATAFALAVTHPAAGNIGGGGFIVYRPAKGQAEAYDFREMAPARASPTMFLKNGTYDATLHHEGHRSVGVPGTVAGLHLAWSEHGRLPWKRLVSPAVALATKGFVVSEGLARSLEAVLPEMQAVPGLGRAVLAKRCALPGRGLSAPAGPRKDPDTHREAGAPRVLRGRDGASDRGRDGRGAVGSSRRRISRAYRAVKRTPRSSRPIGAWMSSRSRLPAPGASPSFRCSTSSRATTSPRLLAASARPRRFTSSSRRCAARTPTGPATSAIPTRTRTSRSRGWSRRSTPQRCGARSTRAAPRPRPPRPSSGRSSRTRPRTSPSSTPSATPSP